MAFLRAVIRCSVSKKYGTGVSIYNLTLHGGKSSKIRLFLPLQNCNQIALRSTAAGAINDVAERKTSFGSRRDPLDTGFADPKAAFKSKTTWEVLRAYVVYQLCSVNYLVEHNNQLMKISKAILGEKLFTMMMKATFYGHFVAGEDQYKIVPTLKRLHSFGVKPILDYSVEEDITQEEAEKRELAASQSEIKTSTDQPSEAAQIGGEMPQFNVNKTFADRRYKVSSARTYFYLNEANCERNVEVFQDCLHAVAGATYGTGITAVKLTALGRPQLLSLQGWSTEDSKSGSRIRLLLHSLSLDMVKLTERTHTSSTHEYNQLQLSEVIMRARNFVSELMGSRGNVLGHHMTAEVLEKKLKDAGIVDTSKFLEKVVTDSEGVLHLFPWSGIINEDFELSDTFRVPSLKEGRMVRLISQLTKKEEEMFRNMVRRVNTLVKTAQDLDVRIMIDAEQTYFQPAISRITMEMMNKFNKEKAIVFNTYQCYLKEALNEVTTDLEQAKRQNFYFGAKLVRGAYIDQERARAAALGYPDPTNPTYEATTDMYHRTLTECLSRIKHLKEKGLPPNKIGIMVASHNEDTVRFAIEKMKEIGISPEDKVICFGQLLGMCDYITFPLGQAGYSAYKYIPYGPVNEVLPYLSRRAQENKGVLKKIQKEKSLLFKELVRRVVKGRLFYNPRGEYQPV